MNKTVKKLKESFLSKQFVIFIIIGVINTFNGTIFSYIFSNFSNANAAFLPGYILGMVISYILNSFITFREKPSFQKLIKFSISSIPNFIIQYVVVIICNLLGLHKLFAYMLAAIIGVPVTFLLMKFFAFSKK
jgi:putative flippase GtrA